MTSASPSTVDQVRALLVGLKMARALEALDDVMRRLEQGEISALEAIHGLLTEEFETRESRRVKMGLMTARLTRLKTLQDYDFSFQPSLERDRVLTLAQLHFIERNEVVHLLEPPGTGKTHLATALGIEAVKAVYFGTLGDTGRWPKSASRESALRSW